MLPVFEQDVFGSDVSMDETCVVQERQNLEDSPPNPEANARIDPTWERSMDSLSGMAEAHGPLEHVSRFSRVWTGRDISRQNGDGNPPQENLCSAGIGLPDLLQHRPFPLELIFIASGLDYLDHSSLAQRPRAIHGKDLRALAPGEVRHRSPRGGADCPPFPEPVLGRISPLYER